MPMTNSELLEFTGPPSLLGAIEKQRRYVLRIEAEPKPCPNCAHPMARWDALGLSVDEYDLSDSHPDLGRCPSCQREVRFTLPFVGGWHWSLVPIQQSA